MGGYSQIKAEMALIKASLNSTTTYRYIHMMSGTCFPIKDKEFVYNFFIGKDGQFVTLELEERGKESYKGRFEFYHFFQDRCIRNEKNFWSTLNNGLVRVQKMFRIKKHVDVRIYHGSNWFSITYDAAKYVVDREKEIKKLFEYGCFVDELFLQTILMNSKFRSSIIENNLRLIDWNRGDPYVWTVTDFDELINSDCLFARKFDENKSASLITKLMCEIHKSDYMRCLGE